MPDVYVTVRDSNVEPCKSVRYCGLNIDYDSSGNVTGVEILDAIKVDVSGVSIHVIAQDTDDDGTGQSGNHTPTL